MTSAVRERSRLDVEQLARLSASLLIAAIIGLASLVVFVALPQQLKILRVIQKLGHPGVFALIAICVISLLRRLPGAERNAWRDYLIAFVICTLLGGATEIAQIYTHRDPALADVALDARGAVCALLLLAAFDRRTWLRRSPSLSRGTYLVAFASLAVVILMPLVTAVAAYVHRAQHFPVLFAADSARDLYFIEPINSMTPLRVAAAARASAPAGPALLVPLVGAPYAGVEFAEPCPDWSGFHSLRIEVTNPGPQVLLLNVRVDDRGPQRAYGDRYDGQFRVEPGKREVLDVSLDTIASAPTGRRLNLKAIGRLILFRDGDAGPSAMLVHRIALQ